VKISTLKKVIGRKARPNSRKTFPNKKAATIVCDAILFHGAKVAVDVHNMYRSRLFRRLNMDVAADRTVTVQEDDIEYSIDSYFARIRLREHKRGEQPPYGAFVWELPKRALKKFPLLIEYTKDGELTDVSVLRNSSGPSKRRSKKSKPRRNR
jgi:hypothetical protein